MSLSVSRLVRVTVNLSALAAAGRSFGVLMVAGDSNVISGLERLRTYFSFEAVEADFGTDAPETKAAELYFGQTPQPSTIMIGRWLRVATAAENIGGILAPSEALLSNWTNISSGGLVISIDGSVQTLTGLDFTGATNLNGVASVITAALSGGATCVWDGTEFKIISGSSGAGVKADGSITLTGAGTNLDTITVNGTLITLVSGTPTGSQVKIGGSAVATAANLQLFLQNSADTNIAQATYALNGAEIDVTFKVVGVGGNAFTLAKSSTAITLSGSNLTSGAPPSTVGYATAGTGTDISAQLKLTSGLSQALVAGYDAESPVECVAALALKSPDWYGLMFQASVQPTDDQNMDVAEFVEALDITRIFGVTISDTSVLSPLVTNDLASRMMAEDLRQSTTQYSQNIYAIASLFGRAFSVDFTAQNSTITLMYKQEPGVVPEELNDTEANTLKAKRCNVYVNYANGTSILEYGTMEGDAYFDEIHGLDWFQNALQTAEFNVMYQTPTKVPQTDAGQNQLTNAAAGVCDDAVFNGLASPGTWNGPSFGELQTGQYLKTGYYIFSEPIALQAQSDREQRKAPPMQIALKLAGAIQELDVIVTVNR